MSVVVGQAGQVVDRIEQRVEMINEEPRKLNKLQHILRSREFEAPIIVFVNQKRTCDAVYRALDHNGVLSSNLVSLHHSSWRKEPRPERKCIGCIQGWN